MAVISQSVQSGRGVDMGVAEFARHMGPSAC